MRIYINSLFRSYPIILQAVCLSGRTIGNGGELCQANLSEPMCHCSSKWSASLDQTDCQAGYIKVSDFNERLREIICSLIDIQPHILPTTEYEVSPQHDFRELISPKCHQEDPSFLPVPYYQVFKEKHGFLPNLSIVDLLFNMGPESALILKQTIR